MFCYQCEQTAKGTGCTTAGVCGKSHEVASLLKATARQVEISERIGEWLEGRSST